MILFQTITDAREKVIYTSFGVFITKGSDGQIELSVGLSR